MSEDSVLKMHSSKWIKALAYIDGQLSSDEYDNDDVSALYSFISGLESNSEYAFFTDSDCDELIERFSPYRAVDPKLAECVNQLVSITRNILNEESRWSSFIQIIKSSDTYFSYIGFDSEQRLIVKNWIMLLGNLYDILESGHYEKEKRLLYFMVDDFSSCPIVDVDTFEPESDANHIKTIEASINNLKKCKSSNVQFLQKSNAFALLTQEMISDRDYYNYKNAIECDRIVQLIINDDITNEHYTEKLKKFRAHNNPDQKQEIESIKTSPIVGQSSSTSSSYDIYMQKKIKIASIIQAIQNYVIKNQDNTQRSMSTKKMDTSTIDHIDGVLKMHTIKWKKAYQYLEPAFQSSAYDNEAKLLNSIINNLLIDPIDDVKVLEYTELLLESCSGYRVANPQLVEHANSICSITKSIVSEQKSLANFALLLKNDATIHYTIDDASLLLKVIKVEFANVDYDGNYINTYSSSLYSTAYYLKPRISISYAAGANHEIDIFVKIISPSGILNQGNTSPQGYSYKAKIKLGKNSYELQGWGNKKQTCYSEVGIWKIELWFNNTLLYQESFNISLDPEIARKKKEEEERRRRIEEERQRQLQRQREAAAAERRRKARNKKIKIGIVSVAACVAVCFAVKYISSYINYHFTEYNSLINQAELSSSNGDYNEAINFYELAKERKSNSDDIVTINKKIQTIQNIKKERISELISKIDAIIKSNSTSIKYGVINYDDPKKMINEILSIDPSNARAKSYASTLDAQKKRI